MTPIGPNNLGIDDSRLTRGRENRREDPQDIGVMHGSCVPVIVYFSKTKSRVLVRSLSIRYIDNQSVFASSLGDL